MVKLLRTAPALLFLVCQFASSMPAMADEQIRGTREQGGYIEQRGWESGLLKANPNLSHYNWAPMTTMIQVPVEVKVQTTMHVQGRPPLEGSKDGGAPPPPRIIERTPYIKPNHVPMPTVVDNPNNNDLSGRIIPRSHYTKPNTVDLAGKLLPRDKEELAGRLMPRRNNPAEENVSAQLASRDGQAKLLNYKGMSAGPGGALPYSSSPNGGGNGNYQAKADVSGQVVSRGSLLRGH